jgi:hypothetical protein
MIRILQKDLSAALRMRDRLLDGREGVGCCYRYVHPARCDRLGRLLYSWCTLGRGLGMAEPEAPYGKGLEDNFQRAD